MADKVKLPNLCSVQRLVAIKDPKTGKYGVCYRKYCTFAHSMSELRPR